MRENDPGSAADLKQQVRQALERTPNLMTLQLARELGVPEADVIRAMPDDRAVELEVSRWEELLRGLEEFGQVHVIVSNGATTMESVGHFGGFSTWGEFFNVQTKSLDMHIRWPNLGSAFAVEKPSHMDGVNTISVQFYDRDGHSAFKVFLTFGGRAPAPERATLFDDYRVRFRKSSREPPEGP